MKKGEAGGRALAEKRGPAWMAAIGQAGGLATVRKYSTHYMSCIGRKGGQATVQKHGAEHFRRLARYKTFVDTAKWNDDAEMIW